MPGTLVTEPPHDPVSLERAVHFQQRGGSESCGETRDLVTCLAAKPVQKLAAVFETIVRGIARVMKQVLPRERLQLKGRS